MNAERKYQIIVGPHVSEKSAGLAELPNKQIVLKVLPSATKNEIKEAVEFLFKVKVQAVRVLNIKPQKKCSRARWVCVKLGRKLMCLYPKVMILIFLMQNK